jgi:hypothetical protein
MVRGAHEIILIGAERTVGEVTPGLTEAGESGESALKTAIPRTPNPDGATTLRRNQ